METPKQTPSNISESIFAKPLTWAVIVAAGVYAVSRIFKKSETFEEKKDERKMESEGLKPSYPESSYKGFADAIYAARSANKLFGTDEDAIYAVFKKMRNDLDVAKLITAFGKRRLSFSLNSAALGGFLADELNESELNTINNDLRSRNIRYQF